MAEGLPVPFTACAAALQVASPCRSIDCESRWKQDSRQRAMIHGEFTGMRAAHERQPHRVVAP